jgi:hypothetical protein
MTLKSIAIHILLIFSVFFLPYWATLFVLMLYFLFTENLYIACVLVIAIEAIYGLSETRGVFILYATGVFFISKIVKNFLFIKIT